MTNFNLDEACDAIQDLENYRDYFDEPVMECLTGVRCIKSLQERIEELEDQLAYHQEEAITLENRIEELEAERQKQEETLAEIGGERDRLNLLNDMRTKRCYPDSVVMIGDTGHYVNDAVKAHIEELEKWKEHVLLYNDFIHKPE